MPRKPHKKPTSKKQAALFGAIAGGKSTKATGLSKSEAKAKLKGAKVKSLPKTAPKAKGKRKR